MIPYVSMVFPVNNSRSAVETSPPCAAEALAPGSAALPPRAPPCWAPRRRRRGPGGVVHGFSPVESHGVLNFHLGNMNKFGRSKKLRFGNQLVNWTPMDGSVENEWTGWIISPFLHSCDRYHDISLHTITLFHGFSVEDTPIEPETSGFTSHTFSSWRESLSMLNLGDVYDYRRVAGDINRKTRTRVNHLRLVSPPVSTWWSFFSAFQQSQPYVMVKPWCPVLLVNQYLLDIFTFFFIYVTCTMPTMDLKRVSKDEHDYTL